MIYRKYSDKVKQKRAEIPALGVQNGSHHCYPVWVCTRWKCDVAGPGIWTYSELKEIEVYTSIIDETVRKLHLCAKILSAFPLGVCKHCIFHCFTIASTHITWLFFYQQGVKKGCMSNLSQVLSSLTLLATEHQKRSITQETFESWDGK